MKQVADREKSDRDVLAAFSTHGGKAANAADARLRPHLEEGEAMPDIALVVKLVERSLAAASRTMSAADRVHTAELGDDAPKRDARDNAGAAVVAVVTTIRMALTGRFGADFGGKLGDVGAAPRTVSDISNWGWKVLDALKVLEIPPVDLARDDSDEVGTFSKDDAVKKLERRLNALDQAATDVAVEEREAEATLVTKNDAIAKHDDAFGFAAAFLETLLEGAGERELAAKVTPSTRRPGQTVVNANDPTPPVA